MKHSITIIAAALGLTIFLTSIVFETVKNTGVTNVANESNPELHIEALTLAKLNFNGLNEKEKDNLIGNYILSANDFLKKGQFNRSERIATILLISEPDNFKAMRILGKSYFLKSKFDKAELVFRNCLDLPESSSDDSFMLGLSLLRQSKYNDALIVFKPLLKLYPKNAYLNYYMACSSAGIGKTQDALDFLTISSKSLGDKILPLLNDPALESIKTSEQFLKIINLSKSKTTTNNIQNQQL